MLSHGSWAVITYLTFLSGIHSSPQEAWESDLLLMFAPIVKFFSPMKQAVQLSLVLYSLSPNSFSLLPASEPQHPKVVREHTTPIKSTAPSSWKELQKTEISPPSVPIKNYGDMYLLGKMRKQIRA